MDLKEKVAELLKDKAFAEKAKDCKSLADVSALLKEHGVEATVADLEGFRDSEGVLKDDELENVAGGGSFDLRFCVFGWGVSIG